MFRKKLIFHFRVFTILKGEGAFLNLKDLINKTCIFIIIVYLFIFYLGLRVNSNIKKINSLEVLNKSKKFP